MWQNHSWTRRMSAAKTTMQFVFLPSCVLFSSLRLFSRWKGLIISRISRRLICSMWTIDYNAAECGALLYCAVDMFAFVAAEWRRSSVLFCCAVDMLAFAAAEICTGWNLRWLAFKSGSIVRWIEFLVIWTSKIFDNRRYFQGKQGIICKLRLHLICNAL